jgi:peptidoglycan/LPS O-acetylase OafA/YrhL
VKYRPEIDGLRALAVLGVVLFHFRVAAFSGGFVGVDIFFVISGYLITSIIAHELAEGAFTYREFYARRARRILPASLAVFTAVAVFGWFEVRPSELVVLGKSLLAAVCFASNFLFLSETDYFGAESSTLHLLHTWSLAVEEQFYLGFPLLMVALSKASAARRFRIVAAIASLSLVLCLIGTWRAPALTFYVLPTRAWELLIGSLVALRAPQVRSVLHASVLTLVGLALLGLALFVVDADTPFPGFAALAPTVGAALIIIGGSHATAPLRFALGNPVMVGIGKISYSMYLWHWPLAVVYFADFEDSKYPAWMLLAPLLLLSYVSYRWIEQPFRKPQFLSLGPRLGLALGVSAALCSYGLVAITTHGMVFGLEAQATRILDPRNREHDASYGGECFQDPKEPRDDLPVAACLTPEPGKRTILLWGDSLAAHHSIGLKRAASRGVQLLQATLASCPAGLASRNKVCSEYHARVFDHVDEHPPDLVVLSGNWRSHRGSYRKPLQKLLGALNRHRLRVAVLGPALSYTKRVPDLLVEHMRANRPLVLGDFIHPDMLAVDADFKTGAVSLHGATLISIHDLLCGDGACPALTPQGTPMQWDNQHLTRDGSIFVGKRLMPMLEAELDRPRPRGP